MSWIVPSFLQTPVLPTLPYNEWQTVVHDTIVCIRICGSVACPLTFLALDARVVTSAARWGRFVPTTLIFLPGVTAGIVAAFRFDSVFEVFQLPVVETGSYLLNCALWAAVPQFLIAIVARWLYDRQWPVRASIAGSGLGSQSATTIQVIRKSDDRL